MATDDTDATSPSPRPRRAPKPATPDAARSDAAPVAVPVARAARRSPSGPPEFDVSEESFDSMDMERGAIGRLDAREVSVAQGAIGAARADSIRLDFGAVGAAMARDMQVSRAGIGSVLAGQVRMDQAAVRMLVARDVVVERPSFVGFLVAPRISGDVRVLFDWRGAAVFAVIVSVIMRLRRGRE